MKKLIYLDYAATTPILPDVSKEMIRCLSIEGDFGNPASELHHYGWDAEQRIKISRKHVAELIHADPEDIIWTSGATESNNLALKGITDAYKNKNKNKHIITSQIEHKAILDTCKELENQGFQVTYLQPEAQTGLIHPEQVAQAIQPNTILISLMMVNNEIGTLTDVETIGALAQQHGILFHVDAAQAAGKTDIDVKRMHIDLLSLSAHKVYGPKGIGALYVRNAIQNQLKPQIHGGGHERGLRSGTLATQQIVGMGEAFRLAKQNFKIEQQRLRLLRNKLFEKLNQITPIILNGHNNQNVANYLNVSFTNPDASQSIEIIKKLAAISSSSACNSKNKAPSHVLLALGRSHQLATHSIRFSFGAYTAEQDIEQILSGLKTSLQTTSTDFFQPVLSFSPSA